MRDQTVDQPEFWANLIGMAANAAIASVPDHVVDAANRGNPNLQRKTQKRIKETLKK